MTSAIAANKTQAPAPAKMPAVTPAVAGAKPIDNKKTAELKQIPRQFTGTHSFMVNTCKFTVDTKYQPLKPLGRGAYGVVCSAIDRTNDRKVAIKKIPKAFEDMTDAKRILREVKLLRHFKHENIIGLYDLIHPPENGSFDDLYIVLDFMETDLHQIVYSKNELTDEHVQYFIYQVLRGLKFIHSAHVIHRDLKPSNLLLNGNCDLKICDFGLARGVSAEADYELTEYVVTRWYRAPEVMCSCQQYDHKIDVWSTGCILAEILGRKPLFPGDDYIKQMNLIFGTLGTPTEQDMSFITNEKALEYIRGLTKQPKVPWSKLFPTANPQALDLLDKMLAFNPNRRISVDDALKHPYLRGLHNPRTEYNCKVPFDFDYEQGDMTRDTLKEHLWEEILVFRPEVRSRRDRWLATEKERREKEKQAKAAAKGGSTTTGSTSGSTAASSRPTSTSVALGGSTAANHAPVATRPTAASLGGPHAPLPPKARN